MKKGRLCLVATVLLAGCAATPEEAVDQIIGPDDGFISLTVNVSGDPKLLTSRLSVHFNDMEWSFAGGSKPVNVPLNEGDYTVHASPLSEREWCNVVEPTTITIRVEAGRSVPIAFAVDCPPQVGTARVRLVVTASGFSIPGAVTLRLKRVIGAPYSATIRVSVNDSVDVWEPVGMYELTNDVPSRCIPPALGFAWAYPTPRYAVRAGQATRLGSMLNCRATQ